MNRHRLHLREQRAHQQRRLHALARNHQQREQEHAEPRGAAGLLGRLRASCPSISLLIFLRGAPHVHGQGGDRDGRGNRQHAFPQRLVRRLLEQVRRANAEQDRQADAPVHRGDQLAAAALAEVGQADGDDQERLEAFPESDDECLQHAIGAGSIKMRINLSLKFSICDQSGRRQVIDLSSELLRIGAVVLNIQQVRFFSMTTTNDPLSRRERQILDILYAKSSATAAEVREALPDPPSYSAVRALLRILEEKGHARHETQGTRYVYLPSVPRESARHSALTRIVKTFFDGSAAQAAAALVDSGSLSDEELTRLSDLIERARKEGR